MRGGGDGDGGVAQGESSGGGGFVRAAPIDKLPQVPPPCAEPVLDDTEASLTIQEPCERDALAGG